MIDRDYKLPPFLNRVLCHVTYLEDCSSHQVEAIRKNPRGFLYWRQLCLTYRLLQRARYSTASITMPRVFSRKSPALMLRSPKKGASMLCTAWRRTFRFDPPDGRARTERSAKRLYDPENHPLLLVWSRTTADKAKKCIDSWRKHCRTIRFWNGSKIISTFTKNGYTEMCCKEKKYAFRSPIRPACRSSNKRAALTLT